MHLEAMRFVMRMKAIFPDYFKTKTRKVVEIGSYNVNGGVKWLFDSPGYFGVDIYKGKGVDIVCDGHNVRIKAETYISVECFEHDVNWKKTLQRMIDNTTECLIISCAYTGREEHGTRSRNPEESPATTSYYRNLSWGDLFDVIRPQFPYVRFWVDEKHCDIYCIAFKQKPKINPSIIKYIGYFKNKFK
jgi:hypothetical protein